MKFRAVPYIEKPIAIKKYRDFLLQKFEVGNLYFFNEGELKEKYKDWKILTYDNYTKKETHGKGKPHTHHLCGLIARKQSLEKQAKTI